MTIVAVSGTSGAGRAPKVDLLASGSSDRHGPTVSGSASARNLAGTFRCRESSCHRVVYTGARTDLPGHPGDLHGQDHRVGRRDSRGLRKAYDEPFIHLLPEGQLPTTGNVIGSNAVTLQVTVDERAGTLVVVGAIDNLAKGTGGPPCNQ